MSNKLDHSMSLATPDALDISKKQKIALTIGLVGLFILALALFNVNNLSIRFNFCRNSCIF